jgi:transcriptional regulator GlxA family with amidase domain
MRNRSDERIVAVREGLLNPGLETSMQIPASLRWNLALHYSLAFLTPASLMAQTAAPPRQTSVAIVVQNGMELLDFAGPGEVFAAVGSSDARPFRVFTVSASRKPVTSQGFVKIVPDYSIEDAPQADILVIPGGGHSNLINDPRMMAWIERTVGSAQYTLSVCTGALVLAAGGLLDGKEATTWFGAIDRLRTAAPRTVVHENTRFVDNGTIITTAGISAGIDGSLHLVSRLLGSEAAAGVARYMEYDNWKPNSGLIVARPATVP